MTFIDDGITSWSSSEQCPAASLRRNYPDQVLRVFLSEIAPPASAHPMCSNHEKQYLFPAPIQARGTRNHRNINYMSAAEFFVRLERGPICEGTNWCPSISGWTLERAELASVDFNAQHLAGPAHRQAIHAL
jgi:hypothetical protein